MKPEIYEDKPNRSQSENRVGIDHENTNLKFQQEKNINHYIFCRWNFKSGEFFEPRYKPTFSFLCNMNNSSKYQSD